MVKKKLKSKVKKPAKKLVPKKKTIPEEVTKELQLQAMITYKDYLVQELNREIKNEYFGSAKDTISKLDALSNDMSRFEYLILARPEGTE